MTLAYLDECGFSPSQPVCYSWTAPGSRKVMPYLAPQGKRVNVLAAVVPDGLLPSLTWAAHAATYTGQAIVQFVQEAIPRGPGALVVVLDNASIHRSAVVRAALPTLKKQGIHLFFLPPYSPELNRIEPLFGAIKHHDLPERRYATISDLTTAISQAFTRAEDRLLARSQTSTLLGAAA